MDNQKIARELVAMAKEITSADDKIWLTVLSEEGGKYWSEGKYSHRSVGDALSDAKRYLREGYSVVVWQGDFLLGYGNITEKMAMRYGTGTVNRLTKRVKSVKRISREITSTDNPRRAEFLKVVKGVISVRNKFEPTSDAGLFLSIVRDMAVHISGGNTSAISRLSKEMINTFGH